MKRGCRFFLMIILVLALGGTAAAAPQIKGSTGLINIPDADVLANGNFNLGYHLWASEHYVVFNFSFLDDLEMGASVRIRPEEKNEAFLNLKYRILPEKKDGPGLAIGAEALSGGNSSLYLVASKVIPDLAGIRGHLGVSTQRGLFFGASKVLNAVTVRTSAKKTETWSSFPQTTVMLEYDGGNLNTGLRLDLTRELTLDAYLIDLHDGVIGLTYTSRF